MLIAGLSAFSGWASISAIVFALAAGIVLRRMRRAPALVRRMRPHFILGYASFALAIVHLACAIGSAGQTVPTGIWFATAGLIALGAQTFVGASLQDPGGYRRPLRAWHLSLIAILSVALAVHVMANGGFAL